MIACTHLQEGTLDGLLEIGVVGAELSHVSGRPSFDTLNVIVGFNDKIVGIINGIAKLIYVGRRTVLDVTPRVVDVPGDSEILKEPGLGGAFNGGVQVHGGPISADIGGEVRGSDGVAGGARMSEVVHMRDWGLSYKVVPGELNAIETIHLRSCT